ncbi:MAG: sugar phosphate isomerase/epimerase [Ruminococcaceae bacterium]|nr:sugar phosphate isomerase/epimerase [Oscillospiraceae bacterium]
MNDIKLNKSCFLCTYQGDDRKSIFTLIERAKEHGFDAIEPYEIRDIWDDETGIETAKRAKEKLDEYGMKCSCLSRGINMLSHADPVKELKKAVDVAHAIGSPYLHHTMQLALTYKDLPLWQDVEPKFVEVSREVAYYAGEKGMECIYEDQGYLINTPERLNSIITKIGLPNVGVCLDVGNSLYYEIPAEEYAGKFAKLIKHVHVKDYIRKTTCPGRTQGWGRSIEGNYLYHCPIGHGVVDFEKIMTILIREGYNGYYSLEGCGMSDVNAGVKLCLDNLQYFFDRAKENVEG